MAASIIPYLQVLIKQGGSDLHLSVKAIPMIRVSGTLIKLDRGPLVQKEGEDIVAEITTKKQKEEFAKEKSVDFAINVKNLGVFRVNVFMQRHGIAMVLRALPSEPPDIDKLNLPAICKKACNYPNGMVIVTGPTGSGKSTTLAAMVNYINETMKHHIITLEDPIEFMHETKRSLMNQRQHGDHFTSFASALKAALREDPDVILVGEMRDIETIALAITAAETGHLVFGTLHTNSAPKSIDRILDSFPGDQQNQIRSMLSESLRVVISQKLVKKVGGGRLGIHDILVNTPAISNLIREQKVYQIPSMMQTGKKDGMQVIDQVLLEAVREGTVDGQEAWEKANDKSKFAQFAPDWALPGSTAEGTNAGQKGTQTGTVNQTKSRFKKTG